MSFHKYGYDDRFTDLELKEFKDLFQFFDRKGEGTIDTRDLAKAMRTMGALVSDKDVQILAQKYDH